MVHSFEEVILKFGFFSKIHLFPSAFTLCRWRISSSPYIMILVRLDCIKIFKQMELLLHMSSIGFLRSENYSGLVPSGWKMHIRMPCYTYWCMMFSQIIDGYQLVRNGRGSVIQEEAGILRIYPGISHYYWMSLSSSNAGLKMIWMLSNTS